jgi:hypothetical protein
MCFAFRATKWLGRSSTTTLLIEWGAGILMNDRRRLAGRQAEMLEVA